MRASGKPGPLIIRKPAPLIKKETPPPEKDNGLSGGGGSEKKPKRPKYNVIHKVQRFSNWSKWTYRVPEFGLFKLEEGKEVLIDTFLSIDDVEKAAAFYDKDLDLLITIKRVWVRSKYPPSKKENEMGEQKNKND